MKVYFKLFSLLLLTTFMCCQNKSKQKNPIIIDFYPQIVNADSVNITLELKNINEQMLFTSFNIQYIFDSNNDNLQSQCLKGGDRVIALTMKKDSPKNVLNKIVQNSYKTIETFSEKEDSYLVEDMLDSCAIVQNANVISLVLSPGKNDYLKGFITDTTHYCVFINFSFIENDKEENIKRMYKFR